MDLSLLLSQPALEKIEDEYDLQVHEQAEEEYRRDPQTYTLEKVEIILGLNTII